MAPMARPSRPWGRNPVAGPVGHGRSSTFEGAEAAQGRLQHVPSYYMDEHRQIWPAGYNCSPWDRQSTIPRVEDGPTLIRESSAKIMIDADGDGKGEAEWPTRGKYEVLERSTLGDPEKRSAPGRFVTEVGRQEDFYQGSAHEPARPGRILRRLYFTPAERDGGRARVGSKIRGRTMTTSTESTARTRSSLWQHAGSRSLRAPSRSSIRFAWARREVGAAVLASTSTSARSRLASIARWSRTRGPRSAARADGP